MPVNALIIRGLMHYFAYYGDNFKIECPTGSGKLMNLFEVAREIANRLTRIFLRGENGRRPVFGGAEKISARSFLARQSAVLRIFPRRQRRRHRRQPPDGLDGDCRFDDQIVGKLDPQTLLAEGRGAAFGREIKTA